MSRRGITRGLPQAHTAPTTADSTITFLPEAAIGASAEVAGAGTVGFTPAAAIGGFAEIAGDMPVGFTPVAELLPIPSDGLIAWYDPAATYVTKDGSDKISALVKRTGAGSSAWDLAQGTGAKQPTWVSNGSANGGPVLRFVRASATHLASSADTLNQPSTVITRIKSTVLPGGNSYTVIDGRTGNTRRLLNNPADGSMRGSAGSLTTELSGIGFVQNEWTTFGVTFNGASSTLFGRNATYGEKYDTGENPGANGASGIVLGDFGTAGGDAFDGDMIDVLVYNRALSQAELQRIADWLETR